MDFVDKKEELADVLELFVAGQASREDVLSRVQTLELDEEFKQIPLFENIFKELKEYLDDLSRKELKQRVLFIRSYLE